MDGLPARTRLAVNASASALSLAWADVALVGRLWIVAACVRVLKHLLPLPVLVRVAGSPMWICARASRVERIRRIGCADRRPRLRLPGNCLDRSLAQFRLLVAAGASPTLVIGLRASGRARFAGHVWLRLDGEELGGSSQADGAFTQVLSFDARGRATPSPPFSASRF